MLQMASTAAYEKTDIDEAWWRNARRENGEAVQN
jgi:hypothetical protein